MSSDRAEEAGRIPKRRPNAVRLTIEFADGEVQEATDDDAEKWASWFNTGVGMAVSHGETPPDVKFDEEPEWINDV